MVNNYIVYEAYNISLDWNIRTNFSPENKFGEPVIQLSFVYNGVPRHSHSPVPKIFRKF